MARACWPHGADFIGAAALDDLMRKPVDQPDHESRASLPPIRGAINIEGATFSHAQGQAIAVEIDAKRGAVSQNTALQLKRQIIENNMQAEDLHRDNYIKGREKMTRLKGEVQALEAELARRKDQLNRLTHVSPVRGIVTELAVTTIGGGVAPNGNLMTIVPIEDDLLVETKIQPENIAFIRPGLPAVIKITAYDAAIYGPLEGEVISVSPDSMQDEFDRSLQYYRVFICATRDALVTPQGVNFAITPGMLATVDIHTGSKTVLQYLMKPLNRAGEAMRER